MPSPRPSSSLFFFGAHLPSSFYFPQVYASGLPQPRSNHTPSAVLSTDSRTYGSVAPYRSQRVAKGPSPAAW